MSGPIGRWGGEGAEVAAPGIRPTSILQGARMRQQGLREVPACLGGPEGGPALSYRLLPFAGGQLVGAQLGGRGTCSRQSSPRSVTDAGYRRPVWSP